ncbi:hypothetical protein AVEN_257793-1 [Araneus ventricosus]|uniref:Uncharacterized protein n=1 Tax=Araneus ventricosus TaxID=182803 RepID=A0A4Y2KF76_ARAVE|nr:hypothetical protein AVEN_257793-1 [Araneus ventricosus]
MYRPSNWSPSTANTWRYFAVHEKQEANRAQRFSWITPSPTLEGRKKKAKSKGEENRKDKDTRLKSMLKSRRFKTIEKIEENSPQELLEVPRKEPYQQMKAFNLLTVYDEIFHLPDLAFPFGDESLAAIFSGLIGPWCPAFGFET